MTAEIIETRNNSTKSLYVEQLNDDFINVHYKHKKEIFEVQMYIFKEQELSELLKKQEEIYKAVEQQKRKSSTHDFIDVIKSIVGKITTANMGLWQVGRTE